MSYTAIPLEAGQVVYRRGDDGDNMYLVQRGAVEMLDGDDGESLAVYERGDFFGERAVLERVVRAYTMRATEASRLIRVDASGLIHMLGRNPEIAVRMIRKLAQRLSTAEAALCERWLDSGAADEGVSDDTVGAMPLQARLIYAGDDSSSEDAIVFVLDGDTATVGRTDPLSGIAPDVDLTRLDPQLTTSRRHAFIEHRPSGYVILEVRATNGTFVNGRRLRPEVPEKLAGGEEVIFGGVVMRFELSI